MILAHSDIRAAHDASVHFLSIVKGPSQHQGLYAGMDHPLYTPLLSAIIVSYAKPFTDNQGLGVLKKRWIQFAHAKWAESHARILKARHELDMRTATPKSDISKFTRQDPKSFWVEKTYGVGYSIRGYFFTYDEIARRILVLWGQPTRRALPNDRRDHLHRSNVHQPEFQQLGDRQRRPVFRVSNPQSSQQRLFPAGIAMTFWAALHKLN